MAPLSIILHRGVIPLSSMTNCQSDRVPRLPIVINRRPGRGTLTNDTRCCLFPFEGQPEDRGSSESKKKKKKNKKTGKNSVYANWRTCVIRRHSREPRRISVANRICTARISNLHEDDLHNLSNVKSSVMRMARLTRFTETRARMIA